MSGMRPIYVVCDPLGSNSMKSKNPHSGFHIEDYSICLDTSTGNPTRNGGGGIVVQRVRRKRISGMPKLPSGS